ncbi:MULTISPECIES: energy transducer TonB [unclassified Flavobacterium]|uniref:energy transducer TonB n=1 Tax=unclassified Flavobacterium TaxID=196869 RepID=UPI001291FB82|nr:MULTISPECIES: energy transducer TonB [unclassified Flavobacterium]MQP53664.1 energy transducer TonB [Flavobacterium sp. LMO9]MQP63595.1 energy transducer TonB [Flavobacterium sp. LMO6]
MKFLETPEEKKSFTVTSVIFVILFLLFTIFGLTYMDPPPENGIAVNFGTTDTGSGEIQPTEPVQMSPDQVKAEPTPVEEDDVLTQDEEAPVTLPKKEVKKPVVKPSEPKPVTKPTDTKPVKPNNSALNSIIKGTKQDGTSQSGHGDDDQGGDKGNPNGSLYANSFYGNGSGDGNGAGNGTGWGLAGRKLSGNSKKIQDCNESGKVVVKIWVNKQGNVIRAERAQGTTNTNPCLVNPAIATAKTFKWQPDDKAPDTQIGFVVVNFQVGE